LILTSVSTIHRRIAERDGNGPAANIAERVNHERVPKSRLRAPCKLKEIHGGDGMFKSAPETCGTTPGNGSMFAPAKGSAWLERRDRASRMIARCHSLTKLIVAAYAPMPLQLPVRARPAQPPPRARPTPYIPDTLNFRPHSTKVIRSPSKPGSESS